MILTTERLSLRPVAEDDLQDLHALLTSPGVRRFLWDDQLIPESRTLEVIDLSRRLFAERGAGLWMARLREASNALCGFGGLWPFRDPPEYELLYGVDESLWGRGYAPEIARALVRFCFDELDMTSVRASTDIGNQSSIRVLEKLGFAFERRAVVNGLDTMFYERRREPSVPEAQS